MPISASLCHSLVQLPFGIGASLKGIMYRSQCRGIFDFRLNRIMLFESSSEFFSLIQDLLRSSGHLITSDTSAGLASHEQ